MSSLSVTPNADIAFTILNQMGGARRLNTMVGAHNHPSGDPAPSQNDIEIFRKLKEAGEIIGIELHDHIIFGTGDDESERYISLREQDLL